MNVQNVIILSLQRESKHEETMYNCDHVSVTNADRKHKGATMCSDIRYRNMENIEYSEEKMRKVRTYGSMRIRKM